MTAYRSVDPNGGFGMILPQQAIKHLAHAMQALELVAFDAARLLDDAGDGERIMGGKLRVEPCPRAEQLARANGIAEIRHRFAGEDGIILKPALLRPFHFG